MPWSQFFSTERHGHQALDLQEVGRSHFHKDYDRIVFSGAFRKLAGKTQVHPLALNDQIHNRLVHSIEVGSVGRSLGIKLGERIRDQLPSWIEPDDLGVIVQSACLAHDIGNPPFGHAGEFAIRDWFTQAKNQPFLADLNDWQRKDLQTFEGNAQGFRIVSNTEYHLFNGGLRLTYPTLASMVKYPWSVQHSGKKGKFSCFSSEFNNLTTVFSALGIKKISEQKWARYPLSYLMEAADDTCYTLIDLEDAVVLNILSYQEVVDLMLNICADFDVDMQEIELEVSPQRRLSALRGRTMEVIINAVLQAFIDNQDDILNGEFEGDLLSHCPPSVKDGIIKAKGVARDRIFRDIHKTETEIGAYATLSTLLNAFCSAGYELKQQGRENLSYRNERVLNLMGYDAPDESWSQYQIYTRLLDYISGMSDYYANHVAKQINGVS
jgi:dGTPase